MNLRYGIISLLLCLAMPWLCLGQDFYMAENTGQSIHFQIDKKTQEAKIVKDFLSNQNYILLRNEVRLSPIVQYQGINYEVTTISKEAFKDAASIKEMVVTSGIMTIEKAAFMNCKSLKSITLYSVKTIGDKAFMDCDNLQKVVIFTSNPPSLGGEIFSDNEELKHQRILYVPDKALLDYKNSDWALYFENIYGTSRLGY